MTTNKYATQAIVGRDARNKIILDVIGPQTLPAQQAADWLAGKLYLAKKAVEEGKDITLTLSIRLTLDPKQADDLADQLFMHANEDDLNDLAYAYDRAIDRADAERS